MSLSDFVDPLLANLSQTVPDLLREIRCQAPNASVFLVGYPQPISEKGAFIIGNSHLWTDLTEVDAIRDTGQDLDYTLIKAAREAGVRYVPMISAFSEHELGDGGEVWIADRNLTIREKQEMLHPNPKGQIGYGKAVDARIKELKANPGR